MKILLFGRLTEILGQNDLQLEGITDTSQLRKYLEDEYPGLQQVSYQVAVDQEIVHSNTLLTEKMTVALMPPFSGG
ncbi:MAG TPA: MoaD/ThiS family protein [Pedobacter sp.]